MLFLAGFILGGIVGWLLYFQGRREVARRDEEKQTLVQERQIVLEFMHNMVEAIGHGVDRQELFNRVVHAAILSTGALSAAVFELQGRSLRGVAVEGLFPPHRPLPESTRGKMMTRAKFIERVLRSESFQVGEGVVGTVAQTKKGMLIADAADDPRIVKHDDPALKVRSVIVVPIQFRETLLAVLAIVNPADNSDFTETDFSLAQSLADQAALAIHNLDLMELQIQQNKLNMDLTLASSIQSMLLPREYPEVDGLDIDARYLPAQKVGGDLYDVFALGPDKLGIAVADVSGKGIPASLLMAICQSNLRHLARRFQSPSQVLKEMNQLMAGELRKDMFITLVYAIIDGSKGEITMARAGHEKPFHFHKNGSGFFRAETVSSPGMALGMAPPELFDVAIADHTFSFDAGDLFVLYTDGVTEAANSEGTEFSGSRLADAIKNLSDRSARDFDQGILETLSRFAGPNIHGDDITLVTVKHL